MPDPPFFTQKKNEDDPRVDTHKVIVVIGFATNQGKVKLGKKGVRLSKTAY